MLVVGSNGSAAWLFSRENVEDVVVMRSALDHCRVDLRACQAAALPPANTSFWKSPSGHYIEIAGVAVLVGGAFAAGVDVGVHAAHGGLW